MVYTGKSGKSYTTIEPAIGTGGEGSIYKIKGSSDSVLKVFKNDKRTETRHRKLLAMINSPMTKNAMQQVTWPMDVVYENGNFVGYVMPAIKNNEDLNVMYSDKYKCTFSEKITIARNLCAAINSVHDAGQVCGDLNPKNISVDPYTAKVTLVDTDSYHISERNSNRIYRCEVGLPEYLPKEIQAKMKNGYRLDNAPLPTFTKQTDLFALAVHIFALLMNGCHPFACATSTGTNIGSLSVSQPSIAAPQPIDNICTGFFPFYQKRSGISIPKYAPDFDMLPQNIKNLFIRAFVDGHTNPSRRPDAVEWYNALTVLEKNLTTCKKNKKHIYPSHLKKCPWCELENKMKAALPPAPIVKKPTVKPQIPTKPIQKPQPNNKEGLASTGAFWFITLVLAVATQFIFHYATQNSLIYSIFGSTTKSGFENWGNNLAISIGPWGFAICAFIGTCIYNSSCTEGELYGFRFKHYLISYIVSIISAIAWILVVLIISIAISLFACILVVLFICGLLSGS